MMTEDLYQASPQCLSLHLLLIFIHTPIIPCPWYCLPKGVQKPGRKKTEPQATSHGKVRSNLEHSRWQLMISIQKRQITSQVPVESQEIKSLHRKAQIHPTPRILNVFFRYVRFFHLFNIENHFVI